MMVISQSRVMLRQQLQQLQQLLQQQLQQLQLGLDLMQQDLMQQHSNQVKEQEMQVLDLEEKQELVLDLI